MERDINAIMGPRSIAIVGASSRKGSVGNDVFRNVVNAEFQGVVYPVNPRAQYINSVPCYQSLADISGPVDLGIIIVPARSVPQVIEEAAQKGVKGLIIISAGFKEIGGEGAELENRVRNLVRKHGIPLIGPNCLGVINTHETVSMNASFSRWMPLPGNIAFISQSGALCTAVLDFAGGRKIGFSKFVSFGNKADINEIDLLEYLGNDPYTDVILMYLEDITDGRKFIEKASRITWEFEKPILALKSGRSEEGARAASSHTGSLAGSDAVYDAIFYQSGIQRLETIEELFDCANAFSTQSMPRGRKVAIITNAGGPGIMATDASIRHGLQLASLTAKTTELLQRSLPPTANIQNPVDIIGDAKHDRYEAAIRAVLMDKNVDCAVIILTPQSMTDIMETAEIIPRVTSGVAKPVTCSFMGVVDVSKGVEYLETHGIPNYPFPEAAVRSLASMCRFTEILNIPHREFEGLPVDREKAERLIQRFSGDHDYRYLMEFEANQLLEMYGFPILPSRLIHNPSQLKEVLRELKPPVAMKISSPDIVHKFDVGGIKLNIRTEYQARKAYETIVGNIRERHPDARIHGIFVQKMANKGIEVILGSKRDRKFGALCMFGLGGTLVEIFKDVSFRLAPMWRASAEVMVRSVKSHELLKGYRGQPAADIRAIEDCILRLSQLVSNHQEIDELDINPLIVYPEGKGCVVADSRILLKRPSASQASG
ncbi:MAG: acetate--CoA ligase family protein [Deltaproteobacteria bacterium]|nr:acetate--CoA ligase family protein [Deltaproteobacteria bacterium]